MNSQCLNPACLAQNATNAQFCVKCGRKLLLANRYRAVKILGQGGFGRTFKAIDEHLPRYPLCVIKQFLPQGEGVAFMQKAAELFDQEARQLEALGHHAQIPALYAYFSADNRQYLVQEFIEGQTLEQELESDGVFTEQKIRQLLIDLLPVLEFIHSQKVIHRDIKPENLIRRPDGQLVLVDFGAAKQVIHSRLTAVGTVIGSAEFVSLEQAHGQPKYASDLYSLGVTCLYLLTQISPFDLYDPLEDHWVWRNYLGKNPVSPELGKILEKMAARTFRQRYQSVQEVLTALIPATTRQFAPQQQRSSSQGKARQPSATLTPKPDPNDLSSEKGIDYTKLRDLLKAQHWKEADRETYEVMIRAVGKKSGDWFTSDELLNFPCTDLKTIDGLWVKYSKDKSGNSKFGFSVQKQIWQEYDSPTLRCKDWNRFCVRVGWQNSAATAYVKYKDLTFDLEKSPAGEFPCLSEGWMSLWCVLLGEWGECVDLFSRTETCKV